MLGEKLGASRESKGLVQRQVTATLEVDTTNISKVERNVNQVSRHYLKKPLVVRGIAGEEMVSLAVRPKLCNGER